MWYLILDMAEQWATPPWEIEKHCTGYWGERYLTHRAEIAKHEKDLTAKQTRATKHK